jgi:hypothetical protein
MIQLVLSRQEYDPEESVAVLFKTEDVQVLGQPQSELVAPGMNRYSEPTKTGMEKVLLVPHLDEAATTDTSPL